MKHVYPKVFVTPVGRRLSIRNMATALKVIRQHPDLEYKHWNWYPTKGNFILREFRRGLHDRINRRAS